MSTHDSKACCDTPVPTASANYEPKGKYLDYANIKCYVSGSTSAEKAVFFIYDIMGFRQPTLQGADILANAGYLVVMPDFFDGNVCDPSWLGQDTEEKKQKLGQFFGRIQDPAPFLERIKSLLPALGAEYSSVKVWGSIGFCWGGKIVSITAGPDSPWAVGIESSPAKVDPEDAKKATIPIMMLASEGEPADAVSAFDAALTVPKHVETFSSQVHGWMSARADLANEQGKKEYERGYKLALDFLATHM